MHRDFPAPVNQRILFHIFNNLFLAKFPWHNLSWQHEFGGNKLTVHRCGAVGALLLSATLLAGLVGFSLMAPRTALADCSPVPAANGAVVLCTGTDTDGFTTTFDQITVNVLDGAEISSAGGPNGVIQLGLFGGDLSPNSTVNLFGSSVVTSSSAAVAGLRIDGGNGTIILNDGASVQSDGIGIILRDGGSVTLNDHSSVNALGLLGITTGLGVGSSITLNDHASVTSAGVGLRAAGGDSVITLNDDAKVTTTGGGSLGIASFDSNGAVTLNDRATVQTSGNLAYGININGTGNVVTLNDASQVMTSGTNAPAIRLDGGANTLVNHGTLRAANADAVEGDDGFVDTIFNYGAISSDSGTAINLLDGNDRLTLGTGSTIKGTIDGGAGGSDSVTLNGTGSEDDVFLNFEFLQVRGDYWSLSGTSTFASNISVDTGVLAINGAITAGQTQLSNLAILGGSGTLTSPTVTGFGTIAPGNSVGTLTIVGTLSLNGASGGGFETEFDGSGVDRTNVSGAVTLTNSPVVNVIPLNGAGGASGVFLHSDTSITGAVGKVSYLGNGAATVFQTGNDLNLIAMDGSGIAAANFAALQTGLDFLDTVNGAQLDQQSDCFDNSCAFTSGKRLWARGFGRFGNEDAQDGNMAYNYRNAGTAFGGDIELDGGFTLGGSLGYANTKSEVDHNAAEAEIDGEFASLYVTYETGDFFITGIAGGGLQQFDLERRVAVAGGTDTARADTDGFLVGGSLQAGFRLDFPGAWRLTPSAGIAYQYQSVDGYSEHGAGNGNVDVGDQDSDAFRVNTQLNVARTIVYDDFSLIPHVRFGIAGQFNNGDNVAGGFSNGENFTLAQQDGDRVMGLAGAGLDIAFAEGITANIDYDARFDNDGQEHAIIAGVTLEW
jgi:uncharacterized protein with beta-barrel porin domain